MFSAQDSVYWCQILCQYQGEPFITYKLHIITGVGPTNAAATVAAATGAVGAVNPSNNYNAAGSAADRASV